MTQIAELRVHSKQLVLQLNSQGVATGWVHLLDQNAGLLSQHSTAIRIDRNGKKIWSGPIFGLTPTSDNQGNDQLQVSAQGQFQILNQRLVHTGAEFAAMIGSQSYTQLGTDGATTLTYSVAQNSLTTDAAIIFDLLQRANIDSPTGITQGSIYGTPNQRNLTLQRFQYVGQQITQLINVEGGVDFYIDPVTLQMNLYGIGSSGSSNLSSGYGVDRGSGCLFTYPGNCTAASRPADGTKTADRIEAIGQYGVARADNLAAQAQQGLFEDQDSLSDVVDPNILAAFANAEVAVRAYPWAILTFTPRGVIPADYKNPGVPRPFDDYNIGDIVYATVNRGPAFQIGVAQPQAVRVFGFTVNWDDEDVEKVTNLQTNYGSPVSGT